MELLPRPLDPVRSIKLKLGILLVSAMAAGFAFFRWRIGWLPPRDDVRRGGDRAGHLAVPGARDDQAAAGDDGGGAGDGGPGDYSSRVRATARDEVGELADAFNQMAADLGRGGPARRELIANVSHELRTPITALQAVLENIVDGVAQPDPATLRTALAQTERLGRLVTELLDLSRIDAGAHRLDGGVRRWRRCWRRWSAEAAVAARGGAVHRRRLTACGDRRTPTGPGCTRWSRTCSTTRPGTARPAARSRCRRRVGADLVLEVADDGPGIAPQDRERVFERFTRGERAGGGGTGLGLAIARWVVDLHGGTIAVVDGTGLPNPRHPPRHPPHPGRHPLTAHLTHGGRPERTGAEPAELTSS